MYMRCYLLGKANLTPEEVVSIAPRQVLNFFGSLDSRATLDNKGQHHNRP